MENKVNKHALIEFAEQRLEEHIAELKKHYEGRETPSGDEKEKAIDKHLNMFKAVLEEKSKGLGDEEMSKDIIEEYGRKFRKLIP